MTSSAQREPEKLKPAVQFSEEGADEASTASIRAAHENISDDSATQGQTFALAPVSVNDSVQDPVNLVRQARTVRPLPGLITVAELTDVATIALSGTALTVLTISLLMMGMPGAHFSGAQILGCASVGVFFALSLYGISAILPIFGPLALFFLQCLNGQTFGACLATTLFAYAGVDPALHQNYFQLSQLLLTIVFSVLPIFACPLYFAFSLSSKWQTSVGWSTVGLMVCDQNGERASFADAFKRTLLRLFWPILFPAKLANSALIDEWVEEHSKTVLMLKPEHLKAQLLKSKDQVRKSKDKVYIMSKQDMFGRALKSRQFGAENLSKTAVKQALKPDWPSVTVRSLMYVSSMLALTFLMRTSQELGLHAYFHGGMLSGETPPLIAFLNEHKVFTQYLPMGFGAIYLGMFFLLARAVPQVITMTPETFVIRNRDIKIPITHKWSNVTAVKLEDVAGKGQDEKWLVFAMSNRAPVRIRLDIIRSVSSKEEILRAIERWAPHAVKEPEVAAALEPPSDHSYTDIWLEALATPPKRDKLKPLSPGAVLKERQYRVQKTIAVGGQGSVYLANDCLSDEDVVLKEFVLPVYVDLTVRRKTIERFEKEARLLEGLHHDKVVRLLDYFVEDHRAYLVLEHLEGKNLRQVIAERGALDPASVISLAKQMCEILKYLHGQDPQVVHRDFTPDNLILSSTGSLKLIDFNVAQSLDVNATTTGTVVGKPSYLAPEQFRGEPTAQSDIYSMGATLAYLLTGNDPLPIAQSKISEQRDGIEPGLDLLVATCTQLQTELRYKDVGEVQQALEETV